MLSSSTTRIKLTVGHQFDSKKDSRLKFDRLDRKSIKPSFEENWPLKKNFFEKIRLTIFRSKMVLETYENIEIYLDTVNATERMSAKLLSMKIKIKIYSQHFLLLNSKNRLNRKVYLRIINRKVEHKKYTCLTKTRLKK